MCTRLEREQQLEAESVCNLRMEYSRAIGATTQSMKPEAGVGQMIREILEREFPSTNGTNWTDVTRCSLHKL